MVEANGIDGAIGKGRPHCRISLIEGGFIGLCVLRKARYCNANENRELEDGIQTHSQGSYVGESLIIGV